MASRTCVIVCIGWFVATIGSVEAVYAESAKTALSVTIPKVKYIRDEDFLGADVTPVIVDVPVGDKRGIRIEPSVFAVSESGGPYIASYEAKVFFANYVSPGGGPGEYRGFFYGPLLRGYWWTRNNEGSVGGLGAAGGYGWTWRTRFFVTAEIRFIDYLWGTVDLPNSLNLGALMGYRFR